VPCVLLATLASLTFFAGPANAAALSFSESFAATSIPTGTTTRLTFTIRNPNAIGVTNISFSDSLPSGLVFAPAIDLNNDGCGGTATVNFITDTISLSGGSLTSGELCLISLNVEGTSSGVKNNVTGNITSSNGTDGTALASILVDSFSAQFVEGFGADSIPLGGTTALTFKLSNPYANTTLTGIGFTNTLPAEAGRSPRPRARRLSASRAQHSPPARAARSPSGSPAFGRATGRSRRRSTPTKERLATPRRQSCRSPRRGDPIRASSPMARSTRWHAPTARFTSVAASPRWGRVRGRGLR
jgi:uncharacterized repeat protein (TIGR01451 family)